VPSRAASCFSSSSAAAPTTPPASRTGRCSSDVVHDGRDHAGDNAGVWFVTSPSPSCRKRCFRCLVRALLYVHTCYGTRL
jgi:hypothetical protein